MGAFLSPIEKPEYGVAGILIPNYGQNQSGNFKKISGTIDMGLSGYYQLLNNFIINSKFKCDFLKLGHQGCTVDLSVPLEVNSNNWLFSLEPTITWANNQYMNSFYNSRSSFESLSIDLSGTYKFYKNISLLSSILLIHRIAKASDALKDRNANTVMPTLIFFSDF